MSDPLSKDYKGVVYRNGFGEILKSSKRKCPYCHREHTGLSHFGEPEAMVAADRKVERCRTRIVQYGRAEL